MFCWAVIFLFSFPAWGKEAPAVKPGFRDCGPAYAKLQSPYKKILAVSAGAHAIALGAYVGSHPKPKSAPPPPIPKSEIEKYFEEEADIPLSHLLSREDILLKAQEQLTAEVKNRGSYHPLNELLIHSEIRSQEKPDVKLFSLALRNFKKDQLVLKRIGNNSKLKQLEKIDKAVSYLHQKYIRHYCRDFGNLTHFFAQEACGNCQSNTKLVLAHLEAAGIHPPEGYQFGAQLYSDHIAPVLLEKKTKRVLDLVTNEEQATPQAPVYKTSILVHGLVKGMGEKPAVEVKELLLAEADPAALGGPVSDPGNILSATIFEGGAGSFGKGKPIPEHSEMGRAGMGESTLAQERAPAGDRSRMDFSKVKVMVSEEREGTYDMSVVPEKNEIHLSAKIAELCKEELKALSMDSYQHCLDKRYHQRLDKFLAKPAGQMLTKFSQHPEKAADYSAAELRAMADLLDDMNLDVREAMTFNDTREHSLTAHPGIDKIYGMIRRLDEKLAVDPVTFLRFLDNLPPEKRVSVGRLLAFPNYTRLYPFVTEISSYVNDYDHEGYQALRKLLVDDAEMFLYRPKTKLGPKDMVMYLDGDMQQGYQGHIQMPEGQEESLIPSKEKDDSPAGKTGHASVGGGVDEEIETKLRLAPATVAALIPFLSSVDEENNDQYRIFPDGRVGAGKYFTSAVVEAFVNAKPSKRAFDHFETLAREYFQHLDVRDDSDAAPRFFQIFGKEKFYMPKYQAASATTGDIYGGDNFGGPYPLALAKAILAHQKKRLEDGSSHSDSGMKITYEVVPYEEPIIREQDIPEPEEPFEEESTPADK